MRWISALAVGLAACFLCGCGCGAQTSAPAATAPSGKATVAGASGGVFGRIPRIVDAVQPSVVSVLVRSQQGEGIGSGVIWSADGLIVTNNHVVASGGSIEVAFANGQRVSAKVKATDPLSDLAVLTVGRKGLPAAHFRRGLPDVGELAVAIGTPLGLAETVTAGIVSALHRSLPAEPPEGQALVDLLQTDAAISPGNSGGALVDAEGRVMGINVAYIPPQQHAVSIGFAIPSPEVVQVVQQLLKTGHVQHAFLGIQPADVTPDVARRFGLSVQQGVLVIDVVQGSAAAKGGLEPGDVIVALAGTEVRSVEDLFTVLRSHRPGQEVKVEVVRGGSRKTLAVRLTDRPQR